ncbi:MAG TPA: diguanylate cyclase [Aliidongia sp.]|uniref:diguanylate cyclase n=1 Tax=Aliidongia sp. TaxID=1914230 RepID=UPI002DDD1B39|nr:diguanylate cyclase [Aliidongia sp.]HEV2676782.1 diguanylate cyclase [Aliidongia sp.]
MVGTVEDLQRRLAALRDNFVQELPQRLSRVRGLKPSTNAVWPDGVAADLRLLAHSIKGSAGTFGFTELSACAARLERLIAQSLAQAGDPTSDQKRAIRKAADGLTAAGTVDAAGVQVAAPRRPGRATKTLYLLDGTPDRAAGLIEQLRQYGYHPEAFGTTAALQIAVAELEPVVVLIDGSGAGPPDRAISAAAALNIDRDPKIPTVLLAGRGDIGMRLAAARAGIDIFLPWPSEVSELIGRLDHLATIDDHAPYRVMVLGADPVEANRTASLLEAAGMRARVAPAALRILEALADFPPDMLLMDAALPDCTGAELGAVIQQIPTWSTLPILFLASAVEVERQLASAATGADDFLVKPVPANRLRVAVAARAERRRALNALITQDPLTGLATHRAFDRRIAAEIARVDRIERPLTLAILDIDHFRALNERHGYPVGDGVLRSLALLLRRRLRRSDVIGRFGGDRLAVLLPETEPDMAEDLFDRIRLAFAGIVHGGAEVAASATFSTGIAPARPQHPAAELVRAAEAALLEAKKDGAGAIRVAEN